eukprot:CAMPEP_0170144516 /NCGR_PEP_ID=MMETSP0033_2-20121228/14144_1 /TAXON_ID=195969 /ORGANISM="Dolichomastix tenuilepis, Strain CCMP3274" /LENGTH=84 /DNA_ID=CAMNT_0010381021 /DNA_START=51 /DNA_END=305 /DNA_ORIENTATION=+
MTTMPEFSGPPDYEQAERSLRASWKMLTPDKDVTPQMSYSQEKLQYIPPAEGTIPTKHRFNSGAFGQYLDKAVKLKVNLKSTSH